MSEQRIEPHKVTKPIQLLAAWLVGLCVLTTAFLGAAVALKDLGWVVVVLVIAAILNVPLFLYSLFLLQTKYRPEMQEDSFYATYLDKNTNRQVEVLKPPLQTAMLREDLQRLRNEVAHLISTQDGSSRLLEWQGCRIAINDFHPEFLAIRKALRNADIPVASVFGSVNGSTWPEKWVLTITEDASPQLVQIALRELLAFEFDGVSISEANVPGDDEHIYVGGYGAADGYAPITDELREIVNSGGDLVDIKYYVSKHIAERAVEGVRAAAARLGDE